MGINKNHFLKLLEWSKKNYNHLPWRKLRSPYGTLVSEIMLQQTTVSTVLNHFDRFLKAYPKLSNVTSLNEEEMLIAWKGLGYYRRAKNLRNASIEISSNYKGKIPKDFDQLVAINGIGPYTANAILSIGFDLPYLAIDANIERVINRLYHLQMAPGVKSQKKIQSLFDTKKILKFIDDLSPRAMNEALMDLGRVFCQARAVHCHQCPVSAGCQAYKSGSVKSYLNQKKKIAETFDLQLVRVLVKKRGKVLAYKKTANEWLSGQYEIPTYILSSSDKSLNQYPKLKKDLSKLKLPKFKTSITKYKITNHVLELKESQWKKLGGKFADLAFIETNGNISTASIKAIKKVEKECKPDSV